jgi:hypothetical protein
MVPEQHVCRKTLSMSDSACSRQQRSVTQRLPDFESVFCPFADRRMDSQKLANR